jgi:ubiquitin carboxyl-terminal hydrolase 36/42
LLKCFEHFCKPEVLKGNNKYFCERCKKYNDSVKKLSFDKCKPYPFTLVPRVLVIHLKRFDNFQRKIKKFITYDEQLDLNKYSKKDKLNYRLSSVLVHHGNSIYSGHYYCYVRVSDNNWYCFNDANVKKVNEADVLKQTPYLLLYEKVI